MRDDERFEARLEDAFAQYASEMPTVVDAAAVTRRVAAERARPAWQWPMAVSPRAVWVLLMAALLLALLGALAVGARLVRPIETPGRAMQITVVAVPEDWGVIPAVVGAGDEVWFLPGSGLARYDPATGATRLWTAGDDLAFDGNVLARARDGGVWIATAAGGPIRRFDGERIRTTLEPPSSGTIVALLETSDGSLWVSVEGSGLFRWSSGAWSKISGLPEGATVIVLAQARDGSVFASLLRYPGPSSVGVGRFDGSRWALDTQDASGAPLEEVYSMAPDPSGGMWADTSGGLMRFDGRVWQHVAQWLPGGDHASWRPAVGQDGTVWAAQEDPTTAATAMVARRSADGWTTWGTADGLPGPAPLQSAGASMVVTTRGPVVASASRLYRLVGNRWEAVWHDPRPAYGRIWGFAPAPGVDVWLRAAQVPDNPVLRHVTASGATRESLPSGSEAVNEVVLSPSGEPWVATNGGLLTRQGGGWRVVDASPVSAVTVAHDGTVWALRTSADVLRVRPTGSGWRVDVLAAPDAGVRTAVTGVLGPELAVDRAGDLWLVGGAVAYDNQPGLWRYDGIGWALVGPTEDVAETVFGNLQTGPDGAVWLTLDGTGTARRCCEPRDPAAQVARWKDGRWTVFGTQNGLPATLWQLSLAVTPDGTAWLSTEPGLYRYDAGAAAWRLAVGGHFFGGIAAAPDGALWAMDGQWRISDPGR